MREQAALASEILFSIVNIIDKTNVNSCIYFKIGDELVDSKNGDLHYTQSVQTASAADTDRTEHTVRNSGADREVSKKPRFLSG